jgi:phosphoribosylformylglycinamidine (FGAM) synthase-like enzyme
MGAAQAVAEAWRNITATGARPLAITDNMNFGNPDKPEIMGQFAAAIQGMAAACLALDFPVVSGNVSLYNETEGRPILPTPAIGGLGVIEDAAAARGIAIIPHLDLVLIGETAGWLGQSLWLREIAGREEGAPPPVNLVAERRNGDFVRHQIGRGGIHACHDVSDGGLLVALAEMALAGQTGFALEEPPEGLSPASFWFGEDQSRYVVAAADASGLLEAAHAAGVPARFLGRTGGNELTCPGIVSISLTELREAHERFFASWMG